MFDKCGTCNVEFRVEDITVCCEGLCDGRQQFHAKCVGLSYDEGCACLHDNIFWMCNSCKHFIECGRFRKAAEEVSNDFATRAEMKSLKSEVEQLHRMVSQIAPNIVEPNQSTTHQQDNVALPRHSSPLSSTKFNAIHRDTSISCDGNLELFVSNIATDVSEDEVKHMVCETLGATNVVHAKCLVASGTDLSTLDYVSYKIIVDARYRSSALRRSSWPNGVRCREFRKYSHDAWRPSTLNAHTF